VCVDCLSPDSSAGTIDVEGAHGGVGGLDAGTVAGAVEKDDGGMSCCDAAGSTKISGVGDVIVPGD
jgi:hypothetical protein